MILSGDNIKVCVKEIKLIENFSLDCLEGAGYDLRVGKIYKIEGSGFIGSADRRTPDAKEIPFSEYTLEPDEYVLIETIEKINMPDDLAARVLPRSSLFRCGCSMITALVDPGYNGVLIFGLRNVSKTNFVFEKNAKMAQIIFEEVKGKTKSYEGRYQGGRVV